MIAEAGAAISSIKVAMDMAKGIGALKTEADINQAIIDIQRILLEAQSGAFEDKQRIADLSAQIQVLKYAANSQNLWKEESQRYVLTESEVGTYTYDLKPENANGETPHRLCVTCFQNGKKSILHGQRFLDCNVCEKRIKVRRDPPIAYSRTDGYF
jgi:hypothetical protein